MNIASRKFLFLVPLFAFGLASCSKQEVKTEAAAPAPVPATSKAPKISAAQVSVKPVTVPQLKKLIAAQKGSVVVVNFWATWCSPCVAELPVFRQLAEGSGGKVKVILVSGDEPSEGANIKSTLAARGHTNSLLMKEPLVPFFNAFDPSIKESIGLPYTYIYDKNGKLVKFIHLDHKLADYQKWVAPYL